MPNIENKKTIENSGKGNVVGGEYVPIELKPGISSHIRNLLLREIESLIERVSERESPYR